MTAYHTIVFMQGDDAAEALAILDKDGTRAAIAHLSQWDFGTECEHSPRSTPPWGSSDHTEKRGNYTLSYNLGLGYISLTRTTRMKREEVKLH